MYGSVLGTIISRNMIFEVMFGWRAKHLVENKIVR
jgi:hypothetical protein